VQSAPAFADYWESALSPLMRKSIVIAHNAGFDLSATEQALFDASIPDPGILYMDSLAIAQALLDADSYKLCDLAALAGHEYQAHNAGEDAFALVRVLEYMRNSLGLEDIPALLLRSGCPVMSTDSNRYEPRKIATPKASQPTHCKDAVEPVDGVFASLRFCVTGDIPGYERADIERIILEHSGKPTGAVSGKTDYLILGEFEDCAPGFVSGKLKKALELQELGGKIRIISPDEFFAMLEKR
jgi:NAD-dependent DNA ligase